MALKAFFTQAFFSGRGTAISGGPKVDKKHSSMNAQIQQCHKGELETIVDVQSEQNNRNLISYVTIYPQDGREPITYEITTRY